MMKPSVITESSAKLLALAAGAPPRFSILLTTPRARCAKVFRTQLCVFARPIRTLPRACATLLTATPDRRRGSAYRSYAASPLPHRPCMHIERRNTFAFRSATRAYLSICESYVLLSASLLYLYAWRGSKRTSASRLTMCRDELPLNARRST